MYTSKDNIFFFKILTLSIIITVFNLLTMGNSIGAVGSIPLFFFIFFKIFNGEYANALFWHLIFISLSISSVLAHGIVEDGGELPTMYNYANLKILGPVSLSYLVTIIIFLCTIKNRPNISMKSLLHKTLYLALFLAISGNIIGILGFLFYSGNSIHEFVKLNIYIWMTIITILSVIKTINPILKKKYYISCVPLLCGAVIGSIIGMLLGIKTSYGGVEIPMTPDVIYFAPILILAVFSMKRFNFWIFSSMILYLFLLSRTMGGKTVFIILFIGGYLLYLIFFNKEFKQVHIKNVKTIRFFLIILIIAIGAYVPTILMDKESLASYKIQAAMSIFGGDISNSPATRVAEFCNFVYNNRSNPFHLLFGMGYGGYFTDELNMLVGLDLSGGWSPEVIRTGRFPSAHDTFSEVPLINGFIGLAYILYIGLSYIKRIKSNYIAFAAVPWLILTFYFTPSLAFTAIYFLTGAEYEETN